MSGSTYIWEYFEKLDNQSANCKKCDDFIHYNGDLNLLKAHLDEEHAEIKSISKTPEKKHSRKHTRLLNNPIWNLFHRKTEFKDRARCKLCHAYFSYSTTTGYLKKHVERKHFAEWAQFISNDCNEGTNRTNPSDPDVRFSNEVIGYFEFESAGDRSKCTVCGETVSNQVEDQRAHLEDQHAALLAKIIRDEKESSEIDQDESRQDEDIFQEVLYLEEDAEHVIFKPRKPKKIKTEPKRKHSIYEEQYSQHSEPYIIKKQRSDDEIDSFLKYISVLIRKIPKEHSPKLQMDIISLIMNTQIAASTNTSIVSNTSSVTGPVTSVPEYTITVTNSDEK